ncbi:MAG TPA: hypothetical protein VIU11_19725 [Nakamurella sp.]
MTTGAGNLSETEVLAVTLPEFGELSVSIVDLLITMRNMGWCGG